jgi:hypothetical protein
VTHFLTGSHWHWHNPFFRGTVHIICASLLACIFMKFFMHTFFMFHFNYLFTGKIINMLCILTIMMMMMAKMTICMIFM